MKKSLLLLYLLPAFLYGQQTITSVQNGNATNPLVWDCFCFPTADDNIIINHAIGMDVDWAITGGGSITVNSTGSFIQSGVHSILVDGTGSYYSNYGNSSFLNIAYTNGASGTNTNMFSIQRALYVGPGSNYMNTGTLNEIDSLMTEGVFVNDGTCNAGNILNTGSFTNSGQIAGDSVGNTGTFNSLGGFMYFNAFGNTGTFSMTGSGFMDVTQNWFNAGEFTLGTGLQIFAHNNFYNGDSLTGSANLHNNGRIEVTNDFYNNFFMDGNGNFCVGDESFNSGSLSGSFDFCDNTGTNFDWNTGTIAGTITFCQPGCFLSLDENEAEEVYVYPNPTTGIIQISAQKKYSNCSVYAISGQLISTLTISGNSIDLSTLNRGTYFLQFAGNMNSKMVRISVQ